jgi:hypothetical protein
MPCLVGLIIFSILGIFSASHRKLAREAFDCVFRRVTLRPCTTGFDVTMKAKVLGPLLPRFPKIARAVARHFETIAWVFMVLMTASTVLTARGVYNFWAWGDCNGQFATGGFCAFDPTGENSKLSGADGAECTDMGLASSNLSLEDTNQSLFLTEGTGTASLFFIGCYSCDYTRKTYPLVKEVLSRYPARYTFAHYVTKTETNYLLPYDACVQQLYPEKFTEYVDGLFQSTKEQIMDETYVRNMIVRLGMDIEPLSACLTDAGTTTLVRMQQSELAKTGVYGTPTIFINGEVVVGPKPTRIYERLLKGWWL